MKSGYLFLETHAEHPGLVRFLIRDRMPSTEARAGAAVRYVARFGDVEAAQMHVQNSLRRSLLDIDEHLYRVDLPRAMAVVEADDLSHTQVWVDQSLSEEEKLRVEALSRDFRSRRKLRDSIWQLIGKVALVLLLLGLLVSF